MADTLTNAEFRVALGSINYNATNFQVFSFGIAFTFLIAMATIAGITVAITASDQELSSTETLVLTSINTAMIVALFLSYSTYLRNIGKYIYGRIRPIAFDERSSTCGRIPTGTSLAFQKI
jgi:hypothetical protein